MNRVLRLPRNTAGRDFIAGDIHGCFGLLDRALEVVGFDAQRDRLIVTGDLVDRGPEPMRALDYLARDWFHSVTGNHDFFFAEGLAEAHPAWANHNGGAWYFDIEPEDRRRVREALSRLPHAIELETGAGLVGVVHAEVPRDLSWQELTARLEAGDEMLMWDVLESRDRARAHLQDQAGEGSLNAWARRPVAGVHQVYCGHTIMPSGPGRCGNTVFLDTGAFLVHRRGDGALTLLDVPGNTGVAVERHGHVQVDLRAQPNPSNEPALEWSPAL